MRIKQRSKTHLHRLQKHQKPINNRKTLRNVTNFYQSWMKTHNLPSCHLYRHVLSDGGSCSCLYEKQLLSSPSEDFKKSGGILKDYPSHPSSIVILITRDIICYWRIFCSQKKRESILLLLGPVRFLIKVYDKLLTWAFPRGFPVVLFSSDTNKNMD